MVSQESEPSRAERQADCNFLLARRRPAKQQVGDAGAGDHVSGPQLPSHPQRLLKTVCAMRITLAGRQRNDAPVENDLQSLQRRIPTAVSAQLEQNPQSASAWASVRPVLIPDLDIPILRLCRKGTPASARCIIREL
jgi:hypothetical protein